MNCQANKAQAGIKIAGRSISNLRYADDITLMAESEEELKGILKVIIHVLLKPALENFQHYFASVWGESNCAIVWAFFGIAFLWDWNEGM